MSFINRKYESSRIAVQMPATDAEGDAHEHDSCPGTSVRKVARKQKLEGVSYSVDELRQIFVKRKPIRSEAKFWRLMDVKTVSVTDSKDGESICFDRVVLQCTECNFQHGAQTIAPSNFASSHFHDPKTASVRCKKAANEGKTYFNQVAT